MLPPPTRAVLRRAAQSSVARIGVVIVGMVLCVEVFASITWVLSGAGSVDLASLDSVQAPERHPTQAKVLHAVSEWQADAGTAFQEAPQWAQQAWGPGTRSSCRLIQ